MAIYQINLTPINAYFFGGEKHSRNFQNRNGFEMDYFAESELYPQQTTLLGGLRYYLLLKNNLLNPAKKGKSNEANDLIGNQSFVYGFRDENKTEQSFGKIKSISSLYFSKDGQKYIVAPIDNNYGLQEHHQNYILNGYSAKEPASPVLINLADNATVHFFKENKNDTDFVFSPYPTVGNKKGEKGKSEDDGFYKFIMYRLNKGWSFAFEAEIDEMLPKYKVISDEKDFIHFGAEKQTFCFEISNINSFTNLKPVLKSRLLPGIYCISDCFVSEKIWDYTSFAVNENVSFRNLQSKTTSQNYSSFSKGYKRGNRYNLLKRGSVLYFADAGKLNQAKGLFENQNAQNIGFNLFQLINKQS